jgi:hypothetical protein
VSGAVTCVDIGSTWTEPAPVELSSGQLSCTAQAPTDRAAVVRGCWPPDP